ncbi:hypothetical protein F2Q69_00060260 [Brassica cretica]|uniref:Uncharacterized protein n=1 Tax=Brassica cretica TaxID=69181 RepID=A0A8S9RL28_BRACR|nr:hypothetical protein F2Q69_00060260 [Brassica cretica]
MGATSPERHREVAVTPFQSDLARATPRCRSRLHRSEARERLGQSDTIRVSTVAVLISTGKKATVLISTGKEATGKEADRYGERGLVILSRVSHRERDSVGVIEESHRPPSRRATERDADCFIIEERSLHRRGEIMKQRGSRRGEMTKQWQRNHESKASSSKRDQEREAESPTDSSIIHHPSQREKIRSFEIKID